EVPISTELLLQKTEIIWLLMRCNGGPWKWRRSGVVRNTIFLGRHQIPIHLIRCTDFIVSRKDSVERCTIVWDAGTTHWIWRNIVIIPRWNLKTNVTI